MKAVKEQKFRIPKQVSRITNSLKRAGFKAFLVGGCTRDLILGKKPKDWDITTNATPEETLAVFPNNSFYENKYGTVGVKNEDLPVDESGIIDETLRIVEVTTFRKESTYTDGRRPDSVLFSKNIEEDLERRDFTINAIAIDIEPDQGDLYKGHIVDLYNGRGDLADKLIKTVGRPHDRFSEDALRIMRAVRLATELDFDIDKETIEGIRENAHMLKNIAKERIRDEFVKMIASQNPLRGLILSQKLGILPYISKEFEVGIGVSQNKTHKYNVWEHLLKSLEHAAKKNFSLEVRLAALFHDIGKPKSRRWSETKKDWTFHGHEVIGERITRSLMEDLRFPVKTTETVCKLVRWHMFFSDTEQISLSAVRRMVSNVGKENISQLMDVRTCDRIGTGRPKENPYRLRKYRSLIEQVMTDPISVSMLKIKGSDIIRIANIEPSPKIGFILHALLEEVLDDPKRNTAEYLEKKVLELAQLDENSLKKLGEKGKETSREAEEGKIKSIRKKYFVE